MTQPSAPKATFEEWWADEGGGTLGLNEDCKELCSLAWKAAIAAHPLVATITPVVIGIACREAGENLANATKALVSQTRKLTHPPGLLGMAQELADLAVRAWELAKESTDA